MKSVLALVLVSLVAGPAAADEVVGVLASPPLSPAGELLDRAKTAAARGDCRSALDLGLDLQATAPATFRVAFVTDPFASQCLALAKLEAPKSPALALALPLALVAIGGGLAIYSAGHSEDGAGKNAGLAAGPLLVFGPSAGSAYNHHLLNRGLAVRGIGAGLATIGVILSLASCPGFDRCGTTGGKVADVLGYGGLVIFGAGSIWEIADAPRTAARHNRRIALSAFAGGGTAGVSLVTQR